ncbi:MAG: tyrosine--tRNA ligase [Lentisphaerae bacterium]|nr:tyrosine--tRNA ligase [Lentisphaerota bacterium]
MENVLEILRARGLFEDCTSPDLEKVLQQPGVVYAGFDPSSDSLQAGNFVTIMTLAHFQRCGHRVIALAGGATGMIGDPSGKSSERSLLTREQVEHNTEGIRENLSRFLDFDHPTAPAVIVNNSDWLGEFSFLDFLRDVGKHFRMGAMLGRDSVRTRLASESGMSFTEFSYALLQAYDFLHLHDAEGCLLQVGGSDQWGNITAGTDLVRKLRGQEVYGVTTPLVCDSAGQKFGKSEGNAVYLDARKTSPYSFYQFFYRTTDADVIRFLKIFTFLSLETIVELGTALQEAPERREAQQRLADEVTRAVHGDAGLHIAQQASQVLFGGSIEGLSAAELVGIFAEVPSSELPRSAVTGAAVLDVAAAAGLCASKGAARRLIESGGLYLNNNRVTGIESVVQADDLVEGQVAVLRSGKKNFYLVRVVD